MVINHVFQFISKLKRFVPVLLQLTLALNSSACWSGNYVEHDEVFV